MKEQQDVTLYSLNKDCKGNKWDTQYEKLVLQLIYSINLYHKKYPHGYHGLRENNNYLKKFNYNQFLKAGIYLFDKGQKWIVQTKKVI